MQEATSVRRRSVWKRVFFGFFEFRCEEVSVNSTDADRVIWVFRQRVFPLGVKLHKFLTHIEKLHKGNINSKIG